MIKTPDPLDVAHKLRADPRINWPNVVRSEAWDLSERISASTYGSLGLCPWNSVRNRGLLTVIAAAERSVASANALIGVAEAAWFPSLTLNGSYGFSSGVLPGLLNAKNALWSFGPSLAENVFNGGATLATNHQARDNYDEAVATYRQTVLSAFESVEDDLVTLRVLEQQGQLQELAVKDARLSEELTLNQYKSGIVVYSSVITVQTTRLLDEINLLSIQSQRLVSSVDLISQLGGGWDAEELRL